MQASAHLLCSGGAQAPSDFFRGGGGLFNSRGGGLFRSTFNHFSDDFPAIFWYIHIMIHHYNRKFAFVVFAVLVGHPYYVASFLKGGGGGVQNHGCVL